MTLIKFQYQEIIKVKITLFFVKILLLG